MILCRAVIIKPAVGLLLIATSDLFQTGSRTGLLPLPVPPVGSVRRQSE